MDAYILHRFHFAFTVTYHYLFPQLTMGLSLLIVVLKTLALRRNDPDYDRAAHFWGKIFGLNFAMGVVTGIPMEFQFGTNWSRFAEAAGGVIGQTLALEGVYSFFLESTFLGLLLYGRNLLGRYGHWAAAFCVFAGSWLSGFFIIMTDAWMQHPVGYKITPQGAIELESFWALVTNPWGLWQYAHNMMGSVMTASVVMAAVGAFYLLNHRDQKYAQIFLRIGVLSGLIAALSLAFPTGHYQGENVARYQPVTLAAMEGHFETAQGAPIAILGQPDPVRQRLDNPLLVPKMLSFLIYRRWSAEVKGLNEYPRDQWPDNIPLLYYSFHIMIGLGTLFIALMLAATFQLYRGKLFESKPLLWALMLALPFPYIANTAGWLTAELGRQPWVIYGLMRTRDGFSPHVSAGNTMFTLLGFMGLYLLLGILFLFLMAREIEHGPSYSPVVGSENEVRPAVSQTQAG
ncbi:MAG: cytochrome ubiquinol oxidase subunit I [Bryobacteraceae bacterium]|nr:cytochrome ubiquinol oxidase subunit I [Bryobacteraceae bacterium]MDW8376528.1 cytochrome ubiquinol oxidase subunit I [Bryobacterales bacterium]